MSHPYHHALSSAKKWGGEPEDYLHIHEWFDATKAHFADARHRAMRHHSEGIYLMESVVGVTMTLSSGRIIPTRWVGEQHVHEDLGRIPTLADWLTHLRPQGWMMRSSPLSRQFTDPGLLTGDVELPPEATLHIGKESADAST